MVVSQDAFEPFSDGDEDDDMDDEDREDTTPGTPRPGSPYGAPTTPPPVVKFKRSLPWRSKVR